MKTKYIFALLLFFFYKKRFFFICPTKVYVVLLILHYGKSENTTFKTLNYVIIFVERIGNHHVVPLIVKYCKIGRILMS